MDSCSLEVKEKENGMEPPAKRWDATEKIYTRWCGGGGGSASGGVSVRLSIRSSESKHVCLHICFRMCMLAGWD